MAFRQGFFLVRDLPVGELREALLAAASHASTDAAYERFVVEEDAGWSAVLIVDGYGHAHRWAQAVSFERGALAISFFILEGTWRAHARRTPRARSARERSASGTP